jgi:hypothetical protein
MRMTEDHDVDARSTAGAKEGHEHALSDVDGAANDAASVDQHRGAVREIEERGVALRDVEERRSHASARCASDSGDDLDAHEQRRRDERDTHAPEPPRSAGRDRAAGEHGEMQGIRQRNRHDEHRKRTRDHANEQECARGGERSAALRGRKRREEGVSEAERQGGRFAERDRDEVREDAAEREIRRHAG